MSEYRVKFHREGAMAGPVDLGPYPDKARADKSAEFYREMGNSNVRVVPVRASRRARAHPRRIVRADNPADWQAVEAIEREELKAMNEERLMPATRKPLTLREASR